MRFGYRRLFSRRNEDSVPPEALDRLALALTKSNAFRVATSNSSQKSSETLSNAFSAGFIPKKKGTPAGYVYLGQFIAHDLSFDSMSDRHRATALSWAAIDFASLYNKRNPLLDLETVYGSEKLSNPGEYVRADLLQEGSHSRLRLGQTFGEFDGNTNVNLELYNDLPRGENSPGAQIVDQRNDENLIVAQTHVAFIKFHNAIVDKLGQNDTDETFEAARKIAIKHYLAIIETDFLPRLVDRETLSEVRQTISNSANGLYNPTDNDRFLPAEFVAAAFRYGHSQIRSKYSFNIKHQSGRTIADLYDLFAFTGSGPKIDKKTKNRLRSTWVIDWERFFDFSGPLSNFHNHLNIAEKIDTNIASALNGLMPLVSHGRANSLMALDLHKGDRLSLVNGQQAAAELGIPAARQLDKTMLRELLGKRLDESDRDLFSTNTPLLFYILAEADAFADGETLGPVGGRIVAEVLLRIISDTKRLILPDYDQISFLGQPFGKFGMTDLLTFINEYRDLRNHGVNEISPIQHQP